MINNIKLVAGFASRDKSDILSNVLVKNGTMTAQNGLTGISVSVESDIDFCCNADRLSVALNNCQRDNLKLSIKSGKIYISSGRFKSNIDLLPVENYPVVNQPEIKTPIHSSILADLNSISQFTDPNDVRMFIRGVTISSDSLQATNGHVVIKKDIDPIEIEDTIIPTKSIQLMVKADTIINSISTENNILFFNFEDGYLFTRTIDGKMPDISKIISPIETPTDISTIADAIKSIAPFCLDSKSVLIGKTIETIKGDASFGGFNINNSAFNVDYLLKIIAIADSIDFTKHPAPCPFVGNGIIGAVAGIKI